MKQILLFLGFGLFLSNCFGQDNPYAVFGYKPKAIFADVKEDIYRVKNTDVHSDIKYFEVDDVKHL